MQISVEHRLESANRSGGMQTLGGEQVLELLGQRQQMQLRVRHESQQAGAALQLQRVDCGEGGCAKAG